MLPDRADAQAPLRLVQHEPQQHGQRHGQHRGDVQVQVFGHGVLGGEVAENLRQLVGDGLGHGRALKEHPAEEQGKAGADEVQRNAGDGLVRPAGHGGHGVQQREQPAGQPGRQEAQPGVAGKVADRRAREGADVHHALDADVDHAGAL